MASSARPGSTNGKIAANTPFRSCFVQPASHDAGGALGSALWVRHGPLGLERRGVPMRHAYYGPAFGEAESRAALDEAGLAYEKLDEATLLPRIAAALARGEIVAFAFSFVHSSDVGGKAPGSISPTSTELYQEGLRIPQSKLFEAGKLNRELRDLILLNCRIPEQNWGDIKAQIASLNVAERRLHDCLNAFAHGRERCGRVLALAQIADLGMAEAIDVGTLVLLASPAQRFEARIGNELDHELASAALALELRVVRAGEVR